MLLIVLSYYLHMRYHCVIIL